MTSKTSCPTPRLPKRRPSSATCESLTQRSSCAPYQGNAIAAGIEEAQAHIIDLKTGKPLKKPFIVFREKPDLPWPVRYHAPPYYVLCQSRGERCRWREREIIASLPLRLLRPRTFSRTGATLPPPRQPVGDSLLASLTRKPHRMKGTSQNAGPRTNNLLDRAHSRI